MKPSIGTWITIGHVAVAEVLADTDFDWLCIDLEHTVIDFLDAARLMIAIQAKGKKVYVRVGHNDPLIIKRVLDAGADGIIVPSVNSKEEAIRAVQAVKYPPAGKRGVGLARAQGYGFSFEKYRDETSKDVLLIAQIEHVNAVKELDEILQVDGIDGTFIGPYDLSGSLGKPGEYNDPEVKAVIAKYEEVAAKYDKWIGFHVVPPSHELIVEKLAKGYNFIAFSFDAFFLGTIVRDQLKKLKETI